MQQCSTEVNLLIIHAYCTPGQFKADVNETNLFLREVKYAPATH